MIGGASVSEQVRASARELLEVGACLAEPHEREGGRKQKAKAKVRGMSKNS